ncbi:M15 family metallopeptidase [Neomicrococcus aestuarii]|uniref:SH3b domain-containing protein n=1 Tax=Neomicrococcus aestuarii TaxID=556325 RepID=A0A1L2ZLK7_9MICC|nr:M15 family metallopeptidase [Neomicrococcus aestuarii]APF40273.1 hypothetical protein BHE16_03720 [Neomicrococcus aestuarii]
MGASAVVLATPSGALTAGTTITGLNLRSSYTVNSTILAVVPAGTVVYPYLTYNVWHKIYYLVKLGWVSAKYVSTPTTVVGGREVEITEDYTSNRAGLTDRYWTTPSLTPLLVSVAGAVRISDVPANSVVYRDPVNEKLGGEVPGWFFVRTQGASGWMEASVLARTSTARTSNTLGWTRTLILSVPNGTLAAKHLVAIPWDPEKTLIAAPALADLTRLNNAFKVKFAKNLDVDFANRTLGTQRYLYEDLGPYIAAKPGTSNHGWGMAIDVPETFEYSFDGAYYKWLKANSYKCNWIHRTNLEQYRADGSLNPYAESWHFEYVGK